MAGGKSGTTLKKHVAIHLNWVQSVRNQCEIFVWNFCMKKILNPIKDFQIFAFCDAKNGIKCLPIVMLLGT